MADGHKRFSAWRTLGLSEIPVEVWGCRRLLEDQLRQLRANCRKNLEILGLLFSRPHDAVRLAQTTWRHWWRVAQALWQAFLGRRP